MVRFYKRAEWPVFAMLLVFSVLPKTPVYSQDSFNDGLEAFSEGRYEEAIELFQEFEEKAEQRNGANGATETLYWIGRSHLAMGEYDNAIASFRRLHEQYPRHPKAEDALYHIGRTEYLRSRYGEALVAFDRFSTEYPESDYLGNAGYWSGESLLALGRYDEARELFRTVVEQFPQSYRAEAARYRMELIDLSRRERELLELLRWSNEEQLRLSRMLQQNERAYRQAVESYREQLPSLHTEESGGSDASGESTDSPDSADYAEIDDMREELDERLEAVRLREQALELRETFRGEEEETEQEESE